MSTKSKLAALTNEGLKPKELPVHPFLKSVIKYIALKVNHTTDPNAYHKTLDNFLVGLVKWVEGRGFFGFF